MKHECFIYIHLLNTCFENYTILSTERFAFLGRLELYCRKEHLGDGKLWGLCIVPWKGKKLYLRKVEHVTRGRKVNGRKVFQVNDVIILLARCSGLQA